MLHHVILGEPRHGVTRLGRSLLPAGAVPTVLPAFSGVRDAATGRKRLPPASTALHLHANEQLLGPEPLAALEELAFGRRLALTLHDVPQLGEGASRTARRRELYRALAGAASLVVVCSDHERNGLREAGVVGPIEVVSHPIDRGPAATAPRNERTVGVLGWVYPGKGHAAVLEAMATALPGGTLVALGAVSAGHEELERDLQQRAAALGLGLRVTGFLPDADLLAQAAAIGVPVCAHRHMSASGSLGTWLTAGRVPIVTDGPYPREVLARCPGSLLLTGDLVASILRAADDPAVTVLAEGVAIGPTTPQAAARQAAVLRRWSEQAR